MRKQFLALLIIIILLGACAPLPQTGLAAMPGTANPAEITPNFIEARQGDLWIRVLSPQQNSIVNSETVDVSGQATAGTVVTINQTELLVPPDQFFRYSVTLEPGVNTIEISTQNRDGNRVSIVLTVNYQP